MQPLQAHTTFYELLEVAPSADAQAIKQAYRKLALRYHPDVAGAGEQATALFLEVQRAYEVLADPQLRRQYDVFLLQRRFASSSTPARPQVRRQCSGSRPQPRPAYRRRPVRPAPPLVSVAYFKGMFAYFFVVGFILMSTLAVLAAFLGTLILIDPYLMTADGLGVGILVGIMCLFSINHRIALRLAVRYDPMLRHAARLAYRRYKVLKQNPRWARILT